MSKVPEKMIVGVITSPDQGGYFSNGLHQNAFFLYRLLSFIPSMEPVLLYQEFAKKVEDRRPTTEIFGEKAYNVDLFIDGEKRLDVLLCVSTVLGPHITPKLRAKKTKIVSVIYGNRYVMDQEVICFGHLVPRPDEHRNPAHKDLKREVLDVDAVWVSPHFSWQKDYIRHRYKAPVAYTCPYIWGPELLLSQYKNRPDYKDGPFFKKGSPKNKNIFVTEPNINVVKTSLFAFQTANIIRNNSNFNKMILFGCRNIRKYNPYVLEYFRSLPLDKKNKIIYEDRYPFSTITKNGHVMFHHHFMNGLNYTLLEAAALKLPVVHNSEFMPDLGYYYKMANISDAASQLELALLHEEREDLEEYDRQCYEVVDRFYYGNYLNVIGYKTLIENLYDNKIEPELPQYIQDLEYEIEHGDGYISPLA